MLFTVTENEYDYCVPTPDVMFPFSMSAKYISQWSEFVIL